MGSWDLGGRRGRGEESQTMETNTTFLLSQKVLRNFAKVPHFLNRYILDKGLFKLKNVDKLLIRKLYLGLIFKLGSNI